MSAPDPTRFTCLPDDVEARVQAYVQGMADLKRRSHPILANASPELCALHAAYIEAVRHHAEVWARGFFDIPNPSASYTQEEWLAFWGAACERVKVAQVELEREVGREQRDEGTKHE